MSAGNTKRGKIYHTEWGKSGHNVCYIHIYALRFFYCLLFVFTVVCNTSKVGAGFIIFFGLVAKYYLCYMISNMKLQWRLSAVVKCCSLQGAGIFLEVLRYIVFIFYVQLLHRLFYWLQGSELKHNCQGTMYWLLFCSVNKVFRGKRQVCPLCYIYLLSCVVFMKGLEISTCVCSLTFAVLKCSSFSCVSCHVVFHSVCPMLSLPSQFYFLHPFSHPLFF